MRKLLDMTPTIPPTLHTAWALALFLALAALLKWKHRRMWVEHRINRGLKAFATTGPLDRMADEYIPTASESRSMPRCEVSQVH